VKRVVKDKHAIERNIICVAHISVRNCHGESCSNIKDLLEIPADQKFDLDITQETIINESEELIINEPEENHT